MLQLLLNVAGMAAAGWLTLAIQESVWSRMSARRARLVGGYVRTVVRSERMVGRVRHALALGLPTPPRVRI